MSIVLDFTWEEVTEAWPVADFMREQLLATSGRDVESFKFTQNGRWLIATDSIKNDRFIWDDTTGEWNSPDDLDIEE